MKRTLPMVEGRKKRSCGTCTKCCEGWLSATIHGEFMQPGIPCQFAQPGKGCGIYENRPKDPCVGYSCLWLKDEEIPEWLKPELVNVIIDEGYVNGIPYVRAVEAGATMGADVLTWLIKYAKVTKKNLYWEVSGGKHWIGTKEFTAAMGSQMGPQVMGS